MDLIDLTLPMAVRYVHQVVCCMIPALILGRTANRTEFLRRLLEADRLVILPALPDDTSDTQGRWLIIFRDPVTKLRMLAPEVGEQVMAL
jgi:hypothetical protein